MSREVITHLLPCPFCGHDQPEMVRLGTGRQSCQIACGYCGASHESADEHGQSGSSWNTRAAIAQQVQPEQEPVYQYQMASGNWIDQPKESYDYNVKLGQAVVRVLCASANIAQPVQPDLLDLIKKVHKAKGRHHSQIAMCDLFDACGLSNFRPGKEASNAK